MHRVLPAVALAAIAVVSVACGTSAEDRVKASAAEQAAAHSFVEHYQAIIDGIIDINAQPDEKIDGKLYRRFSGKAYPSGQVDILLDNIGVLTRWISLAPSKTRGGARR